MSDNLLKTIRELADELGVPKAGYMESRTAREDPYGTLHRQHKQRRGEEITNSTNAGSWLLSHHDLHLGEDI
jgi:hypothetical protein